MIAVRTLLALLVTTALGPVADAANSPPQISERAFPGAPGWAATTPGGRGGQILRVTTLAPDGPGSFLAALNVKGPRIIVFEVGGVIDLGSVTGPRHNTVAITEPFLTIAGQTALRSRGRRG